jgi:methionyl-tRNA synthetase
MTRVQPWLYTGPPDRKRLYFIMRRLGEILRIGGILAQPFMPVKAKQMLDALGVKPSRRYMMDAKWRADQDYGSTPRSPYHKPPTLFPRGEAKKAESSGSREPKGKGKGDKKQVRQVEAGKDAAVEQLTTTV